MKPAYERVEFGENCSVRVYHRRLPRIPFEWHHHPEYELTLTLNSHGKRYIGDSITDYTDEDLVLVPPNLPHTWSSNRSIDSASPQVAIVIWFDGEWARRQCPGHGESAGYPVCVQHQPDPSTSRHRWYGDGPGDCRNWLRLDSGQ